MPAPKPIVLKPVHANRGLEARYRRKLEKLIDEMQRSLVYWLKATYRANEPELATDESPAAALRNAMRGLSRRWTKEFGRMARDWGPDFVKRNTAHTDRAFAEALRKAGFTVRFKLTPAVNDVIQASVAENVSLIKSIAAQHLTQVEGIVMRSVQGGRKLDELAADLHNQYGVTRRRAAGIALDQNNKITGAINRARQLDLGIEEAIWMHSSAGKVPRPTHVAMNRRKFNVREGMWDPEVKRFIRPGELIKCRCTSRAIIPGLSK